jgi:hypothetical protein
MLKGERKMYLTEMKRSKKITHASLITTLLILTFLVTLPLTAAHSGAEIYAPPLSLPVTIDGIWSAGEWDDAPQYTMSNSTGGNIGYIRAKFNSTHLFVLVDSPWDTTPIVLTSYWNENWWLAFDTNHNGGSGNMPEPDDYLIHPSTDNTPPNGTGMGWVGNWSTWVVAPLGWGWPYTSKAIMLSQAGSNSTTGVIPLQSSPNSATPHRISEAMIPLDLVGSPGSTVGFYSQLDDDSTDPDGYNFTLSATSYSEWPQWAGGTPGWPGYAGPMPCPWGGGDSWGNLILSAPVGGTALTIDKLSLLAPYIALVSMIAVAGAAAVYFIRRKKLR